MIDSHAHIDFFVFEDDRDDVIKRAIENGIEFIIVPGVESKNHKCLIEFVAKYPQIFCGLGVHPHYAIDTKDGYLEEIKKISSNPNVVAIGEIGIDYHYDFTPKDKQKQVFREQLKLAKELDLPVIIHNREADDDILEILTAEQDGNLRAVMHCFSSSVSTLQKVLDLGLFISFTGNITFKNSDLSEVVRQAPMEKIMIETDSPFMTPVPHRGKRNEPFNVKYIAEKIAEIKSTSIDEVIDMTTKTAKKFFNLSIFILAFLLSFSIMNAQSILDDIEDDELLEEELLEEDELFHPYEKFIGFGPIIGANTVVETYFYDGIEDDRSAEGLVAFGAAITYGVFDYLVIELAYVYSKNTKIAERWDYTIQPNIYQNIELSTHWIVNPYSRINFYGTIGATAFFNTFDEVPANQIGMNGGVGMFINFPSDIGLFNVAAEWRINFEFSKNSQQHPDTDPKIEKYLVKSIAFYSIPRITLLYYPAF